MNREDTSGIKAIGKMGWSLTHCCAWCSAEQQMQTESVSCHLCLVRFLWETSFSRPLTLPIKICLNKRMDKGWHYQPRDKHLKLFSVHFFSFGIRCKAPNLFSFVCAMLKGVCNDRKGLFFTPITDTRLVSFSILLFWACVSKHLADWCLIGINLIHCVICLKPVKN